MNNLKPYNIYLDSHIHFYDDWKISLDQLFNVAYTNLSLNTKSDVLQLNLPVICLLDTEKTSTPIIQTLSALNKAQTNGWKKKDIPLEPYSFWLKKKEENMLVVTGSQINTAEGLEVLVIGNKGSVTNGMPIKAILEQQDNGLLNIIPWAAGKWLSKRGRILTQLLETMNEHQFVLGDNAGRPKLWRNVKQLGYANTHSIPVLSGSDPLPLDTHYLQSGNYGNLIEVKLDLEKPWTSIIQAIHQKTHFKKFGNLSSTSNFILNQLKLRL